MHLLPPAVWGHSYHWADTQLLAGLHAATLSALSCHHTFSLDRQHWKLIVPRATACCRPIRCPQSLWSGNSTRLRVHGPCHSRLSLPAVLHTRKFQIYALGPHHSPVPGLEKARNWVSPARHYCAWHLPVPVAISSLSLPIVFHYFWSLLFGSSGPQHPHVP